MSALKFNLADLIANPDDYTSSERAAAAKAVAELIAAIVEKREADLAYRDAQRPTDSLGIHWISGDSPVARRCSAATARLNAALAACGVMP